MCRLYTQFVVLQKCVFGPKKHDLCYFVAKLVLSWFTRLCKFCLRKSCPCKKITNIQISIQRESSMCGFKSFIRSTGTWKTTRCKHFRQNEIIAPRAESADAGCCVHMEIHMESNEASKCILTQSLLTIKGDFCSENDCTTCECTSQYIVADICIHFHHLCKFTYTRI